MKLRLDLLDQLTTEDVVGKALSHQFHKYPPVFVVPIERLPPVPTRYDMVERSLILHLRLPGHALSLPFKARRERQLSKD